MDKISVSWANDQKNILMCVYNEDGWTWDDIYKALEQQRVMIESVSTPVVDVIVDATNSSWLPRGGSLVASIRKLNKVQHPRQGNTIIVGAHGMIAVIADTMVRIIGTQGSEFQFAKTIDEAYTMIKSVQARRSQQQKA